MENIERRRRIEAESSLTELQVEYTNLIIQHELVKRALNNAERLLNEENSEEYFSDLSYSGLQICIFQLLFSLKILKERQLNTKNFALTTID